VRARVPVRERAVAERNRAMLEEMMRGLGFEKVTIRFERPKV
jgi:hypothetical protein